MVYTHKSRVFKYYKQKYFYYFLRINGVIMYIYFNTVYRILV